MKVLLVVPLVILSGCMSGNPVRPILSCTDCGSLTYYGPQQPDPRVEMARVLTGGLTSLGGIIVGGDVLKSLGSASGATSTIERTTNNTSLSDRSSAVSDTTSMTSVTDTSSVANNSVSNVSSISVTGPAL